MSTMNRDYATLGSFLGLAESAAELRGKLTDKHFVDRLIAIWQEYTKFPVPNEKRGFNGAGDSECHEAGKR